MKQNAFSIKLVDDSSMSFCLLLSVVDEEDSPPLEQNVEELWSKVEHPSTEAAMPESDQDLGGSLKMSRDPSTKRNFNADQERHRLERWQREQERIRQEQYEQEQRRLKEEREKELRRAEDESRRRQENEQKVLQERRWVLQKKAQDDIRRREEEAVKERLTRFPLNGAQCSRSWSFWC